ATMFLLAASKMSRGFARLRQWLILAMRVLAVACLVFVISRPLASGWLGLAAGVGADTTLVLLDRSPSMAASEAGESKLAAGRRQIVDALGRLSSTRWALVESTANEPRELAAPDDLLRRSDTVQVDASADLPAMLQAAHEYMVANQTGRTEIWICSDLRAHDWRADDARWPALRESFARFSPGVRFHLLALARPAVGNLAVRVTNVRRHETADAAQLLISLVLTREMVGDDLGRASQYAGGERPQAVPQKGAAHDAPTVTVPIQFEIAGARSVVEVELQGAEFELVDHPIPLARGRERGWGRVSVPADANLADNRFYFTFDKSPELRAVVVADEADLAEPLRLAASVPADPAAVCTVEMVSPEQAAAIDWRQAALVLWQTALPEGDAARPLAAFVDRGGQVIFFPPRQPTAAEAFGVRWESWQDLPGGAGVEQWRGDQDLLANTRSGAELPLRELALRRRCLLTGNFTPLAEHEGGVLLARAPTPRGGAYFCATTAAVQDSNLASNGIALYVMVQRALAAGAAALSEARQLVAGQVSEGGAGLDDDLANWRRLSGDASTLSTEAAFHAGVYEGGDALVALNRSAAEDRPRLLADAQLAALFQGLDFRRIDARAGNDRTLVEEVWRMFLVAMLAALIAESCLCLPRKPSKASA
ncbi:MAG TPA: BatA domain-containing protein, partial [Pirellulales bacterium]|nr:BatA domain-containing protein [Pirellulales bacterium]